MPHGFRVIVAVASYHSLLSETYPQSNKREANVQKWLAEKGVDLHKRVKLLLPRGKKYEVDHIALEKEHKVVRLSSYHYQYNPIKLLWAQVKCEIGTKNVTFKISDVGKLVEEALDVVPVDN